jgi:hypothetical protein
MSKKTRKCRHVEIKSERKEATKMETKNTGNLPEKKFRAGAISVTVWKNQGKGKDGDEVEYQTISIERNYKDKAGAWQTTNSMRINDLPKASAALQKAYEFIVVKEQELFAQH